jgi:hypothetical protein
MGKNQTTQTQEATSVQTPFIVGDDPAVSMTGRGGALRPASGRPLPTGRPSHAPRSIRPLGQCIRRCQGQLPVRLNGMSATRVAMSCARSTKNRVSPVQTRSLRVVCTDRCSVRLLHAQSQDRKCHHRRHHQRQGHQMASHGWPGSSEQVTERCDRVSTCQIERVMESRVQSGWLPDLKPRECTVVSQPASTMCAGRVQLSGRASRVLASLCSPSELCPSPLFRCCGSVRRDRPWPADRHRRICVSDFTHADLTRAHSCTHHGCAAAHGAAERSGCDRWTRMHWRLCGRAVVYRLCRACSATSLCAADCSTGLSRTQHQASDSCGTMLGARSQ